MIKALKKLAYYIYTNFPFIKRIHSSSVNYEEGWKFFQKRDKYYVELIDAITPIISNDGTMLDVGANIGYFTLAVFERTGFKGKAHLFEPVRNLASLCSETFKGKNYNVTIYPFGLGSENETKKIFLAADGNIGWNTVVSGKANKKMQEEMVEIKKFDDLDIPFPDFIKIDVEGAEYMVFRGMMNKLSGAAKLPVILCELSWGNKHPQFNEVLKTFSSLEKIGYQICDLRRKPVDIRTISETTDILLLPGTNIG